MRRQAEATCGGWPSPITEHAMFGSEHVEREYYGAIFFCAAVHWLVHTERYYTTLNNRYGRVPGWELKL
jgi:hypothetical protein